MACYLVTGAAGFIAYRVCEMLLSEGHQVVGVDNFIPDYDPSLKHWRIEQLLKYKNFSFSQADVARRDHLEPVFNNNQFEAVINLAARAGVRASVEDPWAFIDTNMNGTLNLLEFCKAASIKKFILSSTSSLYGNDAPLPTSEEEDTSHPLQPYAASKKGAEALCHAYHFLYGIDVTIFRYFTVYGPAGRPNMAMFRFVQWIFEDRPVQVYGDGSQTRGFTYVDDIARGTILGLKPLGYEVINLGGHEIANVLQIIDILERQIGKKAIIAWIDAYKADMQANLADIRKATQLLGWQPTINLEEGLQRTVDWYARERSWASKVQTP